MGQKSGKPCPNSQTRKAEKPCPKKRGSRVRKNSIPVSELSDTNRKLTGNKPHAGARGREGAREEPPSEVVGQIEAWDTKVQAIKRGIAAMCRNIRMGEALVFIKEGLVTVEEARKVNLVTIADCRASGIDV